MQQPRESNLFNETGPHGREHEPVTGLTNEALADRVRELEAQNQHLRLLVAELLGKNQMLRLEGSAADDAA